MIIEGSRRRQLRRCANQSKYNQRNKAYKGRNSDNAKRKNERRNKSVLRCKLDYLDSTNLIQSCKFVTSLIKYSSMCCKNVRAILSLVWSSCFSS